MTDSAPTDPNAPDPTGDQPAPDDTGDSSVYTEQPDPEAPVDLTQGGSIEHGPNGAAAESGGTSNPYPTPGLAGDLAYGPDGVKPDKPSYLSTAPQPETTQ